MLTGRADSGINPATLSGAIDVIVVRHVDDNGDVILSSSPFHVRFGKLQVLRAGEKRVTLRLPNNLAPPHIAPFYMKVGETGEAFFVLETDEDVPEELLTSPVVMPCDVSQSATLDWDGWFAYRRIRFRLLPYLLFRRYPISLPPTVQYRIPRLDHRSTKISAPP